MQSPESENLKAEVREFWNAQSCDTQVAKATKHSREYFEEIERFRYYDQPFIHARLGTEVSNSLNRHRFFASHKTHHVDAVAAHIHQRTTG